LAKLITGGYIMTRKLFILTLLLIVMFVFVLTGCAETDDVVEPDSEEDVGEEDTTEEVVMPEYISIGTAGTGGDIIEAIPK